MNTYYSGQSEAQNSKIPQTVSKQVGHMPVNNKLSDRRI